MGDAKKIKRNLGKKKACFTWKQAYAVFYISSVPEHPS